MNNINDYIVTMENWYNAVAWSESYVKKLLKSPSTAKFPGTIIERIRGSRE